MLQNLTIGADPECFLTLKGEPYPVIGLLGGSKKNPLVIKEGYNLVEDNVMPEFNIPPCTKVEEFVDANCFMLGEIERNVQELIPELELNFSPSLRFDEKYLQTEQAKEFGCEPDFSAYTSDKRQPTASAAGNLRTAGGHIHIGWEGPKDFATQQGVCRAFDMMVVLPFMLIEPDNERRQLYGQAGSMRPKSYGVECRQLSCYWLSSKELMRWVFNRTLMAIEFYNNNEEIKDVNSNLCTMVKELISNKDMVKIKEFVEQHCHYQVMVK